MVYISDSFEIDMIRKAITENAFLNRPYHDDSIKVDFLIDVITQKKASDLVLVTSRDHINLATVAKFYKDTHKKATKLPPVKKLRCSTRYIGEKIPAAQSIIKTYKGMVAINTSLGLSIPGKIFTTSDEIPQLENDDILIVGLITRRFPAYTCTRWLKISLGVR